MRCFTKLGWVDCCAGQDFASGFRDLAHSAVTLDCSWLAMRLNTIR
jgi:hypothetical protein